MIEIKPCHVKDTTVCVPGSKSYTHRMLIAAALSDGACEVRNALNSEDTLITRRCLSEMGVSIEEAPDHLRIQGTSGRLHSPGNPVDLGNSGTSMRLIAAVAALGQGVCVLTGSQRMQKRPIQDLLVGLNQMGVGARSMNADGCPPIGHRRRSEGGQRDDRLPHQQSVSVRTADDRPLCKENGHHHGFRRPGVQALR